MKKELNLCYVIIFLLLVQLGLSLYGTFGTDNSSKKAEKYEPAYAFNNCSGRMIWDSWSGTYKCA